MQPLKDHHSIRLVAAAGLALGVLAGCTGATVISPPALPTVAVSAAKNPEGWHDTIDPAQRPVVLRGRITGVTIERAAPGSTDTIQDTFDAPFRATREDDLLVVADRAHEQRYSLKDLRVVSVVHTDATARRQEIGALLIALSVVPFGIAGYGFYSATQWIGIHEPPGPGPAIAVGSLFTAVGLALAIPGIVLVARDLQDPREEARSPVSLAISPGGAQLRLDF